MGFRVATVGDQEKLTAWLASDVTPAERRPDRVRDELLAQCRSKRIEPPTTGRVQRMVRSALRTAEQNWTRRISARLDGPATQRLLNLLAGTDEDDLDGEHTGSVLALIKAEPGNVSLDSMMVEIDKLRAVRAVDLPTGLFADVAPKVLDGWRARAAVEARALREQLRCKEIWVVGADSWRNPDQDLPRDFAQRRAENYRELRKPVDPSVFIAELREEMTEALTELNDALPTLNWVQITDRASGAITLSKYDAAPEPRNYAGSRPRCSDAGAPWR